MILQHQHFQNDFNRKNPLTDFTPVLSMFESPTNIINIITIVIISKRLKIFFLKY